MKLQTSPWLHELSWEAIADYLTHDDIVIIPVGATEQHGRHTAMSVDTEWSIAVAEGAAIGAKVLTVPPIHFGWSPHHLAYPGAITLRPETLIDVLVDVGQSLAYHGFKKLIFINGNRLANHAPMEIAATKLRFQTGVFASVVDVGLVARREIAEICPDGQTGHAGDVETSFMLHWKPELVDMSKAVAGNPHGGGPIAGHPMMLEPPFDLNAVTIRSTDVELRESSAPSGIAGDARIATAEKGKAALEAIVRNTIVHIEQIRHKAVTLKSVNIPI
ncbi:MAG: creatininase family protein [Burkholderiaceae bacterium]|nr:creatininase family protein [Burkholderiaceae bacterium]